MSAVWSILALIIGFVVAYLMYEEYVVDRENSEESSLEMDIQEDLAEMVVEAGFTEAADAAPHRTATGELVDETDAVAAEDSAVAPAAVAVATADETDADEAVESEESASVDAAEEESVAEEVPVAETVVVEERVAVVEIDEPAEASPAEAVQPDDLTKIKGIGKVYAQRLNEAGIVTYAQLIDTDEETLEAITKAIPAANAYDWARQARKLS